MAATVSLAATAAQDTGGAGNDTLFAIQNLIGSAFGDTLTGDAGANRIDGAGGDDHLYGGYGFDLLQGGSGDDVPSGGVGIDTASYADGTAAVRVSLANPSAQDTGGAGMDTLAQFENLVGSAFDDRLTGGRGDNRIEGGPGNDTLLGLKGKDTLIGGDGIDTASYGPSPAGVTVSLAVTGLQDTGGGGIDALAGIENLTGSAFADTLTADAGKNRLVGAGGDDHLDGGYGFDLLVGGLGQDVMSGGVGLDTFDFNAVGETEANAATADRITDFVHGVDRIDLRDIDAQPAQAGDQPFSFIGIADFTASGQAHSVQSGGNTFLELNTVGTTDPEAVIELDGLVTLTATDLLL